MSSFLYILWKRSPVGLFSLQLSSYSNTIYWGDSLFPTEYSFLLCWRWIIRVSMESFQTLLHSIDSCVLLPSLYGLMTVAVQDSLKFGAWYPSSALLSQIVLAIWDVLCFHTRCRIIAFSFVKNAMNCIESVEILGHFNNTTYCNTYRLYL